MKRLILHVAVLLFWLAIVPGQSFSADEIVVGYYDEAPLSYVDSDGSPQGLSIDILRAIAKDRGWELVWKYCTRNQALKRIRFGEIDIHASLPFDYQLTNSVFFTANSIVADWGAVYVKGSAVSNIQDLEGFRVGVSKGDPHSAAFMSLVGGLSVSVTVISFENYREVLEAVGDGLVDAGVANRLFGVRYGREMGVESTPILFNPVSIRFAVSTSSGETLVSELNDSLGLLKADGESIYYADLKRWLSPEEKDSWVVNPFVLWGAGGFFCVLLVVGFWLLRRLSATSSEINRTEEALQEETEVRKRAQVALWESVERHRAMFTDNRLPQLLVDAKTLEIVEINPAAEDFYEYDTGELVGMALRDLNAESVHRMSSYLYQIKQGLNHVQTRHKLANGAVRDVELFVSTLVIHDVQHNFITVVDISERMAAERARRVSEERLDLAVKGGDLAFWDWDIKSGAMILNDLYAEMLGYTLDEIEPTFKGWISRIHPDDFNEVQKVIKRSLDEVDVASFIQFRMRTKSGEWRWFVTRGRVSLRSESGKPLRMTGIAYDINDRKLAEDRLAKINACVLGFGPVYDENIANLVQLAGEMFGASCAFYSRVRESRLVTAGTWNVPEGWVTKELAEGHLSYSLIQEETKGLYTLNNLDTSSFSETDPDVDRYRVKTYMGQVVRVDNKAAGVLAVFLPDNYIPEESDEKLFGIIVAALQVEEERNRSGEQLVEAKEAAEAANLAKSEFLANMSHEIRTPLNGVFGMLQLVSETDLNEEQLEYVTTALTSGRSLLRVINDVLDFSKMEAGMLSVETAPVELRQVVESVLDNFAVQAKEKQLRMSVEIDESVPSVIISDEGRLRQILFNLVGNSVKFTPSGAVSVEAWVSPAKSEKQLTRLLMTISDTGIGIPDDKISSVFSAFSQADGSHTRNYGGTGLGLGIVKRLVNLMGGELAVESGENGTKVHFFVHIQVGEEQLIPAEIGEESSEDVGSLTVLLAEDERVNRISVERLLQKAGHTVTLAEDGEQAIARLRDNEFDIILMDIQMPKMDGITATKAIRADKSLGERANVPIIALTAHAMKGDREEFLAAGMNDYIAKPVEFADLIGLLSRLKSNSRTR